MSLKLCGGRTKTHHWQINVHSSWKLTRWGPRLILKGKSFYHTGHICRICSVYFWFDMFVSIIDTFLQTNLMTLHRQVDPLDFSKMFDSWFLFIKVKPARHQHNQTTKVHFTLQCSLQSLRCFCTQPGEISADSALVITPERY